MTGCQSASTLRQRLQAALEKARAELLAGRTPAGVWEGELSSSALSTATAVIALAVAEKREIPQAASLGLNWLAEHSNADGGWGDTTVSKSNISTTALCWAAFGAVPGAELRHPTRISGAEAWLAQHSGCSGGGLDPARLAQAIIVRYGRDRTFSAPILTACALAGRLGQGKEAWRHVRPLPFELAALPHQVFAALRLPVVSYALPALIAIGLARHCHLPSRNPLARLIRSLARHRTLRVLAEIQPVGGGFLEATPLTSFVVMSLAGSGFHENAVVRKGVEFLARSQRGDGSWPIDTNLSTWVSTLVVEALLVGRFDGLQREESDGECCQLDRQHIVNNQSDYGPEWRDRIRDWLLKQQYVVEHPYTHAAPGGWAWTNLSGGVPDADDTAGALLALSKLIPTRGEDKLISERVDLGVEWLLSLQNRDGGIPTFCRGWGALPFDRSSPDLTAHAIRAWLAWCPRASGSQATRIRVGVNRALHFLSQAQKEDGSWVPLWFGNQNAQDDENRTYGTARVIRALCEVGEDFHEVGGLLRGGVRWLVSAQNGDGGWGGVSRSVPSSVEETALAVEALAAAARFFVWGRCGEALQGLDLGALENAVHSGTNWLVERVESGEWKQPSPIGFYFAKLWYYERLYPQIFTVAALQQALALGERGEAGRRQSGEFARAANGMGHGTN